MGYPSVVAENGGFYEDANIDTFTLNLPSGIVSGDLVLMLFNVNGHVTFGVPTMSMVGWTELFQEKVGEFESGSHGLAAFYKAATAPMGDTVTATTSHPCRGAHSSFRITGWSTIECGVAATGEDAYPNPPTFAPSWGAAYTLWLAVCGTKGWPVGGFPSSYTDSRSDHTSGAYGATHSARRELAAASEDPGVFTLSPLASLYWIANTIAIVGSGQWGATGDRTVAHTQPSLELIRNLEMQCDGLFYVGKSGNAVYESRYARHG